MTRDFPAADRRIKHAARLWSLSMWLLPPVAASAMLIVRRTDNARTGLFWILACIALGYVLSFVLRSLVRRMSHRNTEDKLVSDVKTYLKAQPVETDPARGDQPARHPIETIVAAEPAGFVALKGSRPPGPRRDDLVVYDAIFRRPAPGTTVYTNSLKLPEVEEG